MSATAPWEDDVIVSNDPGEEHTNPSPDEPWMADAVISEGEDQGNESSTLSKVKNIAGRTYRALYMGTSFPARLIGDTGIALINAAQEGANRLFGTNVEPLPNLTELATQSLTDLGVAEPQTPAERVLDTGAESLAGTGGIIKIGQELAEQATSKTAQGVGEALASAPRRQAAGAVLAGSGSEYVSEQGGSPLAQFSTALLAGAAPFLASTGAEAALRGAVRGKSGAAMRENIDKAITASGGTSPGSVGMVAGTARTRSFEGLIARTPGSEPINTLYKTYEAAVGERVDEIADRMSTLSTPSDAGQQIRRGVNSFVDNYKKVAGEEYDKLEEIMPLDTQVPIENTVNALNAALAPIAGAEPLSKGFLFSPKLATLRKQIMDSFPETGLSARLGGFAAHTPPGTDIAAPGDVTPGVEAPKSSLRMKRIYDTNSKSYIQVPDEKASPVYPTGTPNLPESVILSGRAPETLPYAALKAIRTEVGRLADSDAMLDDPGNAKLKALYAALTADMRTSYQRLDYARGLTPGSRYSATRAFDKINRYVRMSHARVDDVVQPLINKGIPEDIYRAATSTDMRRGNTRIDQIMRSLPPEQQKAVASVFIRHLGLMDEGSDWTFGVFLRNYRKLHKDAKASLFSRRNFHDLRDDLDQIAEVADNAQQMVKGRIEQGGQIITSRQATYGAMGAVAFGQWQVAMLLMGIVAATRGASSLMANPKVVHWLAKSTKLQPAALPAAVEELTRLANDQDDATREQINAMAAEIKRKAGLE